MILLFAMHTLFTNTTIQHHCLNLFANYQFRLKLIEALTEPLLEIRRGPGRTPVTTHPRLVGKHFLDLSGVRKRCAVYSAKKVRNFKRNNLSRQQNKNLVSQM